MCIIDVMKNDEIVMKKDDMGMKDEMKKGM